MTQSRHRQSVRMGAGWPGRS